MGTGRNANLVALSVGSAPSIAMGMTYMVMAQSIGETMTNAVVAQKQMQAIATASTVVVTALIIAMGASSSGSNS